MIFYAEAYLSDLLRMHVLDRDGKAVGRASDVAVRLGDTFPLVTSLLVQPRGHKQPLVLPWSVVRSVSADVVTLSVPASELVPSQVEPGDVLLEASILDKQIVDVQGHRVVRVNDLKLGSVQGQVRLIAVGIGTRSFLRRVNLEGPALRLGGWFGKRPEDHLISWEHVHSLDESSQQLHLDLDREKLRRLNPADLADILGELSPDDRAAMVSSLDDETTAAAMEEMDFDLQKSVLDSVEAEKAADILEEIDPDDAADLVGDLPVERATQLLNLMEPEEASDVRSLLKYPDESAGGLMTPDYVALPVGLTAQQAIDYIRNVGDEPETIYYCYIVDEERRLYGVISLRNLITVPADTRLDDVMVRRLMTVQPFDSQEDVSRLIARYNLLAVPVVDADNRMLGIVTVDDAIDAVLPTRWKKRIPKAFAR
jgi:magnesium transporter